MSTEPTPVTDSGLPDLDGELYQRVAFQAREVLFSLLANPREMTPWGNPASMLRRVADVADKYIGLLVALDPTYAGPPAPRRGSQQLVSTVGASYEPYGFAGPPSTNNETFAASVISQIVGVASSLQIGKNLEHTTAALIAAKDAGLSEISPMLEAKLKSLLGHSETGEPSSEVMPEAVPESEEGGVN